MDEIINYLLLVIIFVFDPLAISLVIAANFMFNLNSKNKISNDFEIKNLLLKRNEPERRKIYRRKIKK